MDDVFEDVVGCFEDVALETFCWDGLVDLLDGVIWRGELVSMHVMECTVVLIFGLSLDIVVVEGDLLLEDVEKDLAAGDGDFERRLLHLENCCCSHVWDGR